MALKSSSLMHTPPPPEQQHLPTGTLGGPWGMGPSSSDVIRRTTFACAAQPAQAPAAQAVCSAAAATSPGKSWVARCALGQHFRPEAVADGGSSTLHSCPRLMREVCSDLFSLTLDEGVGCRKLCEA